MEGALEPGWVAPELAEELPGLEVVALHVAAGAGPSPPAVRQRMRELAGRINGAKVIQLRQDTVPWAYRVLWRRLGVDPDRDRTPVEALMVERLERGGIPSRGMPYDAAVVATLETGVPVVVFDADRIEGAVGLRPAKAGERLDGEEGELSAGEVVYADGRGPVARLNGDLAADRAATGATTAVVVCALAAAAVSRIELEEALWIAAELLEDPGGAGRLDGSSPGRTQ